ncbi:hypothetical protein Cni_G07423 [Canna indica]|uniref:HD-ZIP protein N-terminal domain-containing protein n=1 Tax=Canna indica TaxID=4628 RepID=A0AAQ3K236_9LILI|nr:hypothetical protein Cni_G07423 [Canna indica]
MPPFQKKTAQWNTELLPHSSARKRPIPDARRFLPATGTCDGISEEEDDGEGGPRKKLRLSKEQSAVLEESFNEHNTLNPNEVEANRGGLRVPEKMLRKPRSREQKAAEGSGRAESGEAVVVVVTAVLHAHGFPHHARRLSFLRAHLRLGRQCGAGAPPVPADPELAYSS